ncbi:acyl-CoA thioesterase [Rhodohalobacter sp. WB101]|jgi:acyl-CoA hydrolase|uniref:Acyl-CoA thioesterase n=2 Tax=Rhodohalobacter sulfatireducens TaxID=2911366 RepID=A0ABS9KHT6_9BACT|nr:hotdog domain-containing protein [Rhodohalobacter sulfatireducens]MCG2590418.1 acyl-CoA thioesterase [Rhodohalobacter sulfatireducens]
MEDTFPKMRFFSRKLIKPEDLNAHGTLFGGSVLAWVDEEAAIYVICQLGKGNIATKFMSEIDFVSSAKLGDIIEIGMETVSLGKTSITVKCEVRHKFTRKPIIRIDKIVFVHLDEDGRPKPHGIKKPVNR